MADNSKDQNASSSGGAPAKGLPDDLSFEAALKELEDIVRALERGDTPLNEAIAVYERGNLLRQHCQKLLSEAKARIERINIKPDGGVETTSFDS